MAATASVTTALGTPASTSAPTVMSPAMPDEGIEVQVQALAAAAFIRPRPG